METYPQLPAENRIAPQPFNLMIALAIINIVLSYSYHFCPETLKIAVEVLIVISCTTIFFYFRTYLQNSKAEKAIRWINWNIITNAIVLLYSIIEKCFTSFRQSHVLYSIVSMLLFGGFIAITIILGNSLRKIENDYVGLMKQLGLSLTSLIRWR